MMTDPFIRFPSGRQFHAVSRLTLHTVSLTGGTRLMSKRLVLPTLLASYLLARSLLHHHQFHRQCLLLLHSFIEKITLHPCIRVVRVSFAT